MSKFTDSLKGAARGVKRSPKAFVSLTKKAAHSIKARFHKKSDVTWPQALRKTGRVMWDATYGLIRNVGRLVVSVFAFVVAVVIVVLAFVLFVVDMAFKLVFHIARLIGKAVAGLYKTARTAVVWTIALPMIFKQHRAAKVAAEKEAQAFVDEVFADFNAETFAANFTDHSASHDEDLTYTFVDENDIEVVLTVSNEDAPKEAADREPLKRIVRSEVCKSFQDEAEAVTDSKGTSYWFGATQAALAKEMGENLKKAWAFLWKTVNVPDSAFIPKKVREGWNDELATAYELLHA